MTDKTIILITVLFALIVLGMFIYAYIEGTETAYFVTSVLA